LPSISNPPICSGFGISVVYESSVLPEFSDESLFETASVIGVNCPLITLYRIPVSKVYTSPFCIPKLWAVERVSKYSPMFVNA